MLRRLNRLMKRLLGGKKAAPSHTLETLLQKLFPGGKAVIVTPDGTFSVAFKLVFNCHQTQMEAMMTFSLGDEHLTLRITQKYPAQTEQDMMHICCQAEDASGAVGNDLQQLSSECGKNGAIRFFLMKNNQEAWLKTPD